MNKLLKSSSILGLAIMVSTPVFASTIGLNINNKEVTATQAPVMENGTTLVPLRVISENLGAKVDWNKDKQEVTVIKGTDTIVLTIGNKKATVNGEVKDLPQAPKMINGTTMLPVRFVAENLKCEVNYDKGSQTVFVTSDGIVAEIPDTSNWKVTTIKNPKIINGVPYLTKTQMEQAFDVKISSEKSDVSTIERQDTHMWVITKERGKKSYNRINWTFVPNKENGFKVVDGGTHYYPVEFLSPYLNSTTDYNSTSKELKVTCKGIKVYETSKEQMNEIKGYVYLPDGSPAVGVQMRCYLGAWDKTTPLLTETDKNGFYTFGEVDTKQFPYAEIQAYGVDGSNKNLKNYFGEMGKYLNDKSNPPVYNSKEAKRYSNLLEFPVIQMYDETVFK